MSFSLCLTNTLIPTVQDACGIDFSLPSVCTTLAKTNCGDRIGQGEAAELYHKAVAGRFATISELGDLKLESFFPTGMSTEHYSFLNRLVL